MKRNDITFCTMLFRMPNEKELGTIKGKDRKFEEFYLASLKELILKFEKVALWCDEEVAEFLRREGLHKKISIRVMKFSDLPHYADRAEYLKNLKYMQRYTGYLLKNKKPNDWPDYLTVVGAKPAVMDWATATDKFKSDYFMWVDAGAFSGAYKDFWKGWTGRISARPEKCRFSISRSSEYARPHFVPRFIWQAILKRRKTDNRAIPENIASHTMRDIAMVNSDYDIPATSFMMPKNLAGEFHRRYEMTRLFMLECGLISTEQSIFQMMVKFGCQDLFEFVIIKGYTCVYAKIAE
jgi:hypothetical protein